MDEKKEHKKILHTEWSITEPIKLDDVCVLESTGQEFLCSKIIPYEQFEYLYFGSFDFKEILFAVQCRVENVNYAMVLSKKVQQEFAFKLYNEGVKNE